MKKPFSSSVSRGATIRSLKINNFKKKVTLDVPYINFFICDYERIFSIEVHTLLTTDVYDKCITIYEIYFI